MGALSLLLALLSAVSRALHDVGTHAPEKLAHWGHFWDNRTSWKLKYRDYDAGDLRPRFLGARTWLVSLTDGWHLSNMVAWLAADAVVLLLEWGSARWWPAVAYVVVRRAVFEPVYRLLRK